MKGWQQCDLLRSRIESDNKTFCMFYYISLFICPIIQQNLVSQSNEKFHVKC